MKKLIIIILLLIPVITFSQNYLRVNPDQYIQGKDEGQYDNNYIFKFNESYSEYADFKKCLISFKALDENGNVIIGNMVSAVTGNGKFLEDKRETDFSGDVTLQISTTNLLSGLIIGVCFNGENIPVHLEGVSFTYYEKRF